MAVAPAGTATVRVYLLSGGYTGNIGDTVAFTKVGLWRGAGGKWQLPGVPIPGQSEIAVNDAVNLSGTGTPEGVITAAPGSTWLQTDATTDVKGWLRWVKATGTGNTGWIAGPEADTGWRSIPYTDGLANWTANSLLLRRQGSAVTVVLVNVKMATIGTIYALPTGFKAKSTGEPVGGIVRESQSTGNPYWFTIAAANVCNNGAALAGSFQNTYGFNGAFPSFITADAWPASLPGSAA